MHSVGLDETAIPHIKSIKITEIPLEKKSAIP